MGTMAKFSNPFKLESLGKLTSGLYQKQETIYMVLALIVTGLGYFLLALPPLLTLIGTFKVLGGISSATSFGAWLSVLLWIGITSASTLITLSLLTGKTQMPSGLGLKEDKAPRLYELIGEVSGTYNAPSINRVIIHDHATLEMVVVPRFGLPFIKTNVLYIGLPILQSLSPVQFKGALARKLGQFSAEHNRLTHFIYRWRKYCELYQRSYNRNKSVLYAPLRFFFKVYRPIMDAITAPAARRDELEADMYALQVMNDREIADVILRQTVCSDFIKNKYWPKIYAMLRKNNGKPDYLPHISMPGVMRKALTENEFAQSMKELINAEPRWNDSMPDLHSRLENLGQTKLDMPPPVMETAAQRYLGNAFSAVVKTLDKQWLARYSKSKKAAKKSPDPATVKPPVDKKAAIDADESMLETTEVDESLPVEEQKYQSLQNKARQTTLSQNEAYELASLTEKFEGKASAIGMYQKILKNDPNHPKTIFAVGRILLSSNDPSGVSILEKAMELDKGCVAQACWMLAKYYKAMGDEERSKQYLEKAANVSAAA
jgi:tetratricopeptide (TPR) repeat protein